MSFVRRFSKPEEANSTISQVTYDDKNFVRKAAIAHFCNNRKLVLDQ